MKTETVLKLEKAGLVTIAELKVLVMLKNRADATLTGLSAALNIPLSSTSRIIEKLVVAKLADRMEVPGDRRAKFINATDRGTALFS